MMRRRFNISYSFLAIFTVLMAAPACAQSTYNQLDEENITTFVKDTTSMTTGHDLGMSIEEITAYLQRHIFKRARFKSIMKYNIPGLPSQENTISLDKDDFIENVRKGAQSVNDYENAVEIKSIKISKDGTKATVQTESKESGTMPVEDKETGVQNVPIEGISACDQMLTLSEDGVIQMYGAQCVTEITFQPNF